MKNYTVISASILAAVCLFGCSDFHEKKCGSFTIQYPDNIELIEENCEK